MATTIKKKGDRTPRSTDVYKGKGGLEGAEQCECGAVFRNKRWYGGGGGMGRSVGTQAALPRLSPHR